MAADVHHHGHEQYRFCPCCGGALGQRRLKAHEPERLVCEACSFVFYLDPKVVAGTVFKVNGGVALLRRGIEPAMGKWVFPGGYVDRGESVQDAAVRETKEESDLDVELAGLLGVYSYPRKRDVIVVYSAEVIRGEFKAHDECVEAATFAPADIPWDDLAFPSTREALSDYLRLYWK